MTDKLTLILEQLPITLTTAQVQGIWPSGNVLRKWARDNNVAVTVHKGTVTLRRSDKPQTTETVADIVVDVGEKVKKRL